MNDSGDRPPGLELLDRWFALRRRLDAHYDVRAYPFAADRIVNHARRLGAPESPPSLAFFNFWTTASVEAAITCCERHLNAQPDTLPELPPREFRHYNRRTDADAGRACLHNARTLGLTPEHLIGIAVHDLLAGALEHDVPYVLGILTHLVDEIEHHGNLPDPRTIPPREPDPYTDIADPPPPWNCVPGRPHAIDRREPQFRQTGDGSPHFDGIHLDHPESERIYDWLEFCDELAFRYDWCGYPTVEARILQHAFAEGAQGLPDDLVCSASIRMRSPRQSG